MLDGEDARQCATCEESALQAARRRESDARRQRARRERVRLVRTATGNAPTHGGVTAEAVKEARSVVANRERQRRFREKRREAEQARRNARESESVTLVVIRRHGMGADLTGFVDRAPERDFGEPPPPKPGDRECACGRPLNLGRYKTAGDTCGTCKRERSIAARERLPWYVTPEELARQLEDETPIE